jgi:anti-sigma regulatory factor (Ser/Thr protein kinase)
MIERHDPVPDAASLPLITGAAGDGAAPVRPWTIGAPAFSRHLPRNPESARTARTLITTALNAWGLKDVIDPAHLVVTELVANAAQHARMETILVTATLLDRGVVRVSVVDRSRAVPQRRSADDDEEHGRGLELIEVLSQGCWGVDPLRWGKRVWADLEAPRGHHE